MSDFWEVRITRQGNALFIYIDGAWEDELTQHPIYRARVWRPGLIRRVLNITFEQSVAQVVERFQAICDLHNARIEEAESIKKWAIYDYGLSQGIAPNKYHEQFIAEMRAAYRHNGMPLPEYLK